MTVMGMMYKEDTRHTISFRIKWNMARQTKNDEMITIFWKMKTESESAIRTRFISDELCQKLEGE